MRTRIIVLLMAGLVGCVAPAETVGSGPTDAGTPPATLKLIQTIPLPGVAGRFDHFAVDAKGHRLFVAALGNDTLEILVVFDTTTAKPVTDIAISGDTDDLFYDAARKRLYLSCGEGFLDVVAQRDADHYERIERVPTTSGARTSFYSPALDRLWLAVPQRGKQSAEIHTYQPQ